MADDAKEKSIPLALITLGVALYCVAAFVHVGPAGAGATLMLVTIGAAVQTVLLIVAALIVGSLMGVSFGTVPSAVLKFAAATLFAGGLGALVSTGGGLIGLFVFLGLVAWLFEIELVYAIVLTVVYVLVSFVVALGLAAMLRG